MTIKWEVNPYVGVGPLKFGMGYADVADILGKPEDTIDNTDPRINIKKISEYRDIEKPDIPILHYKNDSLKQIVFQQNKQGLFLNDYNLFSGSRKKVLKDLTDKSEDVFEDFAAYIFLDFGITMGTVESYRHNKTINIFAKGIFDDFIRELIKDGGGEYIKGGPS